MRNFSRLIIVMLFMMIAAMFSFASLSYAADAPCMLNYNGASYSDSDCDGYVDPGYDNLPIDEMPADNCPNIKNGNCFEDPAYCNFDNSYDGKDASTLSDQARMAGSQADWNRNGKGDVCEDSDGDGVLDYKDNCKNTPNPSQNPKLCTDSDHDGVEDDGNGNPKYKDNCISVYNPTQNDSDDDGIGDVCDNCALVYNPNQEDSDSDGRGDACPLKSPNVASTEGSISPDVVPYQFGADKTKGSDGCSFVSANSSIPFSSMPLVILFFTLFVIVITRFKMPQRT